LDVVIPKRQRGAVAHRAGADKSHATTRAYVARRTAEGLSKREIMRCLKRYVAREVYRYFKPGDHIHE
jgi:transposase